MQFNELDARLERLAITLADLLEGNFDAIDYPEVRDDPLGRIEEAVQFLVMDTKTVAIANRDKEASLLLQQQQLAAKSELLEQQRHHIGQQEQDLEAKVEMIERQAAAILELSTPILDVWDDVVVLPVIGIVDTRRAEEIMTGLLDGIARRQARWVIIDVTGVEHVDTRTADHLLKVVRAASLLGTSCLLCGIRPAFAQTLAHIGADLAEVATKRNLKAALEHCLIERRGPRR